MVMVIDYNDIKHNQYMSSIIRIPNMNPSPPNTRGKIDIHNYISNQAIKLLIHLLSEIY
ncbi:hypothetical protein [uncultured Methanobrevibacter sp.]|uniref:hypothetical protein n=1 Tax=uncultured Methanobrevibacter sp. TaxID=253161 RepID=UPI0026002DF8|nr:hypothetical protein [uncultured Methanobrevibacter sp.]